MKERKLSKGLVVGVILLFIGVALSPGITAVDDDTETGDEPIDNSENGMLDSYREMISFIDDGCVGVEIKDLSLNRIGVYRISLFRHAEIYTWGNRWIALNGYKFPTKDEPEIYFNIRVKHIIAPFFIGYYFPSAPGDCECVRGIALGNIEWG